MNFEAPQGPWYWTQVQDIYGSVSVRPVISTRPRCDRVNRMLQSIELNLYMVLPVALKKFDVIIVNSASTDRRL